VTLHLSTIEPLPLVIDPRPCALCGLTIDRHRISDSGDGPEFWCPDLSPDEMTLPELERRAALRREEDTAAILARWEMLDPPDPLPTREAVPYRPAASTIDGFRCVAAAGGVARLKAWLAVRPKDAPFLLDLLESETSCC
jgi:hypothetical protein